MDIMLVIFSLTLFYFVLGSLGLFFANRKIKKAEKNERWKKFFTYAIIVFSIQYCIYIGIAFIYISVLLLLISLFEIISVWKNNSSKKPPVLIVALLIWTLISYSYIHFSLDIASPNKMFVYMIVLTFDGFSQVSGQLFGRHKLSPLISPNKTIEGALGGTIMAMLTALLLGKFISVPFLHLMMVTFILCLFCMLGDLSASWYKRLHKVKDYSRLIPGHGGVLDRFDSFIAAGGTWWLLSYLGMI